MKFYTSVNRLGNYIAYRGYENGKRVAVKIPFKPTLFVPDKNGEYELFSPDNKIPLSPIELGSMKEARDFMDQYKDSAFNIYGMTNYVSQFIGQEFPDELEYNRDDVNVTSIDIEVDAHDGFPHPEQCYAVINAITIKNSKDQSFYTWGLDEFDPLKSAYDVHYFHCKDERDLITQFLKHWNSPEHSPDVVTGWNVKFFDIPYLVNRITKVMGDKFANKLSPWKFIRGKKVDVMGREKSAYELLGIQVLDYMDLFKKFARAYGNQESYKLDHIANVVLGDRKISYEEYGNLVNLARDNHQLFIEYNIKDTELIERLEDKLGLISLAMLTAYKAGINYAETFGTVGVWDSIIYRRLLPRKQVPPIRPDVPKLDYPGGYVKDPHVGAHDWICSFDVNSLYPNLIVQYNMSPETIVNDASEPHFNVENLLARSVKPQHPEYSVTANGTYFKKDHIGIIPEIIRSYYDERRAVKLEMIEQQKLLQKSPEEEKYYIEKKIDVLKNKQLSLKNLLNALYGAMANKFFRYFDVRIAESITMSGQLAIKWGEKSMNEAMNKALGKESGDYVVAIDTDSLYVSMTEFVNKFQPKNPVDFLDKACEEHFVPMLEQAHRDMFNDMNGYELRLVMAREVIADRGIWIAKKRYIVNVLDDEGVRLKKPKLKIMGVDAVKSSTPMVVRDKFKEVFQVLITGTEKEAQKYIADFKEEFIKMEPADIAFPRGCNNMEKWSDDPKTIYNKGTPIHVRGALVYNHAVESRDLDKKYDLIGSGDKVKFLYLKMPNSVKENVISFPDILPDELKLRDKIDFNLQFRKTFLDPVDTILHAIGWTAEGEYSLEDFFV